MLVIKIPGWVIQILHFHPKADHDREDPGNGDQADIVLCDTFCVQLVGFPEDSVAHDQPE